MRSLLFRDPEFFPTMWKITLPIALQQLVYASLSVVDTLMVGQLGEASVAAVGLANQVLFLLNLFLFGVSSGSAIFAAQFWGKQDLKGVRQILGVCLMLSLGTGLLFSLAAVLIPQAVLGLYTRDPAVIVLGSDYLRIVGLSYLATAVTSSYAAVLRSTQNVRLPMVVSVLSLGLNTLLNYLTIFGRLGFPALGVQGAAISTNFARVLQCLALLAFTYRRRLPAAARFREMFSFPPSFLKRFFQTSLPVVLTEVVWSLGVTTYNMVYAHIGTEAIAAFSICTTIEGLAFVPFIGLGSACAIIVGNKIGEGRAEQAFDDARRFLLLGLTGALLVGLLLFGLRDAALSLYKISSETLANARGILAVLAFSLWVKTGNFTTLIGILRGGGDTRIGLLVDAGGMWLVGVPMALLGAFVLHLPIYWVVLMVQADEVVKLTVGLPRVFSKKWIHYLAQ